MVYRHIHRSHIQGKGTYKGHLRILSTTEGICECTESLIRQLSSFGRSEPVRIGRKPTTIISIQLTLKEVGLVSEILNKNQNIHTHFRISCGILEDLYKSSFLVMQVSSM